MRRKIAKVDSIKVESISFSMSEIIVSSAIGKKNESHQESTGKISKAVDRSDNTGKELLNLKTWNHETTYPTQRYKTQEILNINNVTIFEKFRDLSRWRRTLIPCT